MIGPIVCRPLHIFKTLMALFTKLKVLKGLIKFDSDRDTHLYRIGL